jgi:imidazolonepropionase-like amidohydrolase
MQWLLAGRLVDGTLAAVRIQMAIGLEYDRISALVPLADWQPKLGEPVFDHRDATVLPGLIDSHVHLVFDHASESDAIRRRVQHSEPVPLALLAARNAAMCLVGGVTTVRDCGDRDLLTLQVRDAIADGWVSGPRLLTVGTPLTRHDGHLAWCGCTVGTARELRDAVRRLCNAGVDWIKVIASGGNMTPGSRPYEPSFSSAELHAAAEEAHQHGRRVAVHALNAEAIRRSIAAGVDTIEHCLWNGHDGQPAFDVDAAHDLVQRGIFVGVNMTGIDRILLSERAPDAATAAVRRAKLRARWAAARQMLALGANVMLSSDAGTRYARFEDFGLTLACAVEALDLAPIEAIHRASLVPARAWDRGGGGQR